MKRSLSILAAFLGLTAAATPSFGAKLDVLYTFAGYFPQKDGQGPAAGVVADAQGNLYGTTFEGGANNDGTVFKLTPDGTETVLYSFAGAKDGRNPASALVMDEDGNLFGTTGNGGGNGCTRSGCGTIFKIAPGGTETILYSFKGTGDGAHPSSLLMDGAGNLFGVTNQGGAGCAGNGCGVVFELTSAGKLKTLYTFSGGDDGSNPDARLIADASGNLYGTAFAGGAFGQGVVFQLSPAGVESVLYAFAGGTDGSRPFSGLLMGKKGALFGTTDAGGGSGCGGSGCGVVYRLDSDGTETILHAFDGDDGQGPTADLISDARGNLYGSAEMGGTNNDGLLFRLTPKGKFSVLHEFCSAPECSDGRLPEIVGGMIADGQGRLYGTAFAGGNDNAAGIVFRIKE